MWAEPLSLPETLINPTGIHKFLLGVPFVGPGARAYRSLKSRLKERTAECLDAWGADPTTLRVRDRVSAIIQEYFFWPNRFYLPHDRCDALFFDPTIDMWDA
jgi:hypothetical protein